MAKVCPRCHTASTDDFKVCPHCGTRLPNANSPRPGFYSDHGHAHSTRGPEIPETTLFSLFKREPKEPTSGQHSFSNSGWSQSEHPHNYVPANTAARAKELPMNWHNFLVKFLLFAIAFVNFFMGIVYITEGAHDNADLVYSIFPPLHIVDTVCGVGMIFIAVLAIATRTRLAGFHRNGPGALNMTFTLMVLAQLASSTAYLVILLPYNILPAETFAQALFSPFFLFLFMLLNRNYYRRRSGYFINM